MKKIKMLLLTLVVITAVTGAYAAKKKFDCRNAPQYYYVGPGNYVLTGIYGIHYYCTSSTVVFCTFVETSPGVFEPCRYGNYSPITPPSK